MHYERRDFIKTAGLVGSGLLFHNLLSGCNAGSKAAINENFGLQLYTLRDVLPADPKGILTQVAQFGYKEIESFEGEQGIFWGMKNTEFKKLMDDLGMKVVASHCDTEKDFERKAAEAAAIGMRYLIAPWLGPQPSLDDYKKAAEKFNERGRICKKNGIRFAYHNHDYSFKPVSGQFPQDVMMAIADKDLVDFEMDIYWVVTAGQDPAAWLNKYPGRFTLSHIKDRKKNVAAAEGNASTVLGTGGINYPSIIEVAQKQGMTHFLVEQELYEGTTPLDATKADAEYMKKLRP